MIPIIRPDIAFDDVAADIRAILESGRLTGGEYVARFEDAVARYVGVRHAFATTSATTALHLSLVAAGIGPGDEVLVSDFTFPASGNVIVQAGAVPVLVDCRPGYFDIDVEDAAQKVTPRTRAIMPVDPFGQPADMAAVTALAERHGLFVVEDAACGLGASRDGRRCGAWPGAGCFSFHPRKVITTGEGGAITTNDDALAERFAVLRSHGGVPATTGMRFEMNGFNYRMSEIQAALGLAQMARIDEIIADRRRTAEGYWERLAGIPGVELPVSAPADQCSFQSLVVLLDEGIDRDAVVVRMREHGVETTLGTYAMHAQPAFERYGHGPADLPQSWRAQQSSVTLPLLPRMSEETVDRVVGELRAAIG